MIEYVCKARVRFQFLLTLLLFGTAEVMFLLPALRPDALQAIGELVWLDFSAVFLFAVIACCGLFGYLNTFTVFRMDEHGITKLRRNGAEQHFDWQAITRTESAQRGGLVLIDLQGQRMNIPPPGYGYHSLQGHDLRHQLDVRLSHAYLAAPALPTEERAFPGGGGAGAAALGFIACFMLFCSIAVPILCSSDPSISPFFIYGVVIGGLLLTLLALYWAIWHATRVITLTAASVVEKTFFGSREIPYAEITGITTKDVQGKSSSTEWTTIMSATRRISFSEVVIGYQDLLALLHAHMKSHMIINSPHAIARDTRNDRKKNVIAALCIGAVVGLVFSLTGKSAIQEGQALLARQEELATRGVQVNGQITAAHARSGKNSPDEIYYAFDAAGVRYPAISIVHHSDVEEARIGEAIRVTYLPENPKICRIPQSNADERAQDQIQGGKILIGFAVGAPLLVIAAALSSKPKYHKHRPD